jgi:hypothetical protein
MIGQVIKATSCTAVYEGQFSYSSNGLKLLLVGGYFVLVSQLNNRESQCLSTQGNLVETGLSQDTQVTSDFGTERLIHTAVSCIWELSWIVSLPQQRLVPRQGRQGGWT